MKERTDWKKSHVCNSVSPYAAFRNYVDSSEGNWGGFCVRKKHRRKLNWSKMQIECKMCLGWRLFKEGKGKNFFNWHWRNNLCVIPKLLLFFGKPTWQDIFGIKWTGWLAKNCKFERLTAWSVWKQSLIKKGWDNVRVCKKCVKCVWSWVQRSNVMVFWGVGGKFFLCGVS